jgi:hypothetical protein
MDIFVDTTQDIDDDDAAVAYRTKRDTGVVAKWLLIRIDVPWPSPSWPLIVHHEISVYRQHCVVPYIVPVLLLVDSSDIFVVVVDVRCDCEK